MSYNITNVEIVKLRAWMHVADVKRLRKELGDELPELCFLRKRDSDPGLRKIKGKDRYKLKHFRWSSEGSGYAYRDVLLTKIAPCIHGEVQAIFTWEGGDTVTGLKIKNGIVIECAVVRKLIPE